MEEIGVKWQIRDEITGKRILTDRLELIIIELPKARRMYKIEPNNAICQWMLFLDNPNQKEVVQIMKENKDINKAIDELEQVSGNEKLRRIAELKEKYIRDEQASIEYAQNEGYRQGEKKGMAEGEAKGEKNKSIEIAKNMLKENVEKKLISKVTGLSLEEIKNLK
jgi:predicted transposase/invertase (TIGR01784 family)